MMSNASIRNDHQKKKKKNRKKTNKTKQKKNKAKQPYRQLQALFELDQLLGESGIRAYLRTADAHVA
jgi:hypothetical protein